MTLQQKTSKCQGQEGTSNNWQGKLIHNQRLRVCCYIMKAVVKRLASFLKFNSGEPKSMAHISYLMDRS